MYDLIYIILYTYICVSCIFIYICVTSSENLMKHLIQRKKGREGTYFVKDTFSNRQISHTLFYLNIWFIKFIDKKPIGAYYFFEKHT